ncbi:hypothetical protein BH09GEM1_BH09GEM1_19610 [soil metagenome]
MTDEMNPTGLALGQVFLLSAQFGHRENVLSLPANTLVGPQQIHIALGLTPLNDGTAYLVQTTVNSLASDDSRLYDFTVTMAGIFEQQLAIKVLSQDEIVEVGAAILFPFVREALANLTIRGRFGPVWLNPISVRAVAARRIDQVVVAEPTGK